MTVLEAYKLVAQAAKQAQALAVLADGLFDVANLEAQAKEQKALLVSEKAAVAAATTEHTRITKSAEGIMASAVSEAKRISDLAKAEAARVVDSAKVQARKLLDDAGKQVFAADANVGEAKATLDKLSREVTGLLDKRDILVGEIDKLKSRFKQLVA